MSGDLGLSRPISNIEGDQAQNGNEGDSYNKWHTKLPFWLYLSNIEKTWDYQGCSWWVGGWGQGGKAHFLCQDSISCCIVAFCMETPYLNIIIYYSRVLKSFSSTNIGAVTPSSDVKFSCLLASCLIQ